MNEIADVVMASGGNTTIISPNMEQVSADNFGTEQHSQTGEIVNNFHGSVLNDQTESASASSGFISNIAVQDYSLDLAEVYSNEFLETNISDQRQSNNASSGFSSRFGNSLAYYDESDYMMSEPCMPCDKFLVSKIPDENVRVQQDLERYQSKASGLILDDYDTTVISPNVEQESADNFGTEQHSQTGEIENNFHGTALNDQTESASASSGFISNIALQDYSLDLAEMIRILEANISDQRQSNNASSDFSSRFGNLLAHYDESDYMMSESCMPCDESLVSKILDENAKVQQDIERYQSKASGLILDDYDIIVISPNVEEVSADNFGTEQHSQTGEIVNNFHGTALNDQIKSALASSIASGLILDDYDLEFQPNRSYPSAVLQNIPNVHQGSDEPQEEHLKCFGVGPLLSIGACSISNLIVDTKGIDFTKSSMDTISHNAEICHDQILLGNATNEQYFQTVMVQNDESNVSQEDSEFDTEFNQGTFVNDTLLKYVSNGYSLVVATSLETTEQHLETRNEQYVQTNDFNNISSEPDLGAESIIDNNISHRDVDSGVANHSVADQHSGDEVFQILRVHPAVYEEEPNRDNTAANLRDQQSLQMATVDNLENQQDITDLPRIELEVGDRWSDVNLFQISNMENPPFPISTDIPIHDDNGQHNYNLDIDMHTRRRRLFPDDHIW